MEQLQEGISGLTGQPQKMVPTVKCYFLWVESQTRVLCPSIITLWSSPTTVVANTKPTLPQKHEKQHVCNVYLQKQINQPKLQK